MISVLIPAYNEADRIGHTIAHLRKTMAGEDFELIVIDDGSRDGTSQVAKRAGAEVITLPNNLGKGGAMNRGVKAAKGEVLLLVDADLSETAGLIPLLLEPINSGEADLTIARFPQAKRKGGFGLVKGLAHQGLYYFTGNRFYSPISGQRALRRQVMEAIGEFEHGWGMEVAMTIAAHYSGFRIKEVPLEVGHRESGRSLRGFIHRGQQFLDIFFTLAKAYWQYRLLHRK